MIRPFQGAMGQNQVVSATGTAASISLNTINKSIRVVNSGFGVAHVRIGDGPQTATTADTVILPRNSLVISKAQDANNLSYISEDGTTLHIQPGEGGGILRFNSISIIDIPWEGQVLVNWEDLITYNWEGWE